MRCSDEIALLLYQGKNYIGDLEVVLPNARGTIVLTYPSFDMLRFWAAWACGGGGRRRGVGTLSFWRCPQWFLCRTGGNSSSCSSTLSTSPNSKLPSSLFAIGNLKSHKRVSNTKIKEDTQVYSKHCKLPNNVAKV